MAIELPPLPFSKEALEPHMSARTLEFHHGKHHKAYVDNLNKLIADTSLDKQPLEEIVKIAAKDGSKTAIFNNAAQAWNHDFFWKCLKPRGGGKPAGEAGRHIEQAFGGFDKFAQEFKQAATSQFGSGWAWLVLERGKLKVVKTPNAVDPPAQEQTGLLTCDVWEHAYYLDYQNRRPDFVQAFLEHLVNWEFVAAQLAASGETAAKRSA